MIREALRLKIVTDETEEGHRQKLLEAIDLGWLQADRGEFANHSLEKTLARLDAGT